MQACPTIETEVDWKLAASQAQGNNQDIEKSFFDSAYQMVQNKVSPFFSKGNFKVGFEIVHKNDDLTKLVGIFIFRVNKELFYMPCFFMKRLRAIARALASPVARYSITASAASLPPHMA